VLPLRHQFGPLAILGVFIAGTSNVSVHAFAPVYALVVPSTQYGSKELYLAAQENLEGEVKRE